MSIAPDPEEFSRCLRGVRILLCTITRVPQFKLRQQNVENQLFCRKSEMNPTMTCSVLKTIQVRTHAVQRANHEQSNGVIQDNMAHSLAAPVFASKESWSPSLTYVSGDSRCTGGLDCNIFRSTGAASPYLRRGRRSKISQKRSYVITFCTSES